jgi:hypothetical protein
MLKVSISGKPINLIALDRCYFKKNPKPGINQIPCLGFAKINTLTINDYLLVRAGSTLVLAGSTARVLAGSTIC